MLRRMIVQLQVSHKLGCPTTVLFQLDSKKQGFFFLAEKLRKKRRTHILSSAQCCENISTRDKMFRVKSSTEFFVQI